MQLAHPIEGLAAQEDDSPELDRICHALAIILASALACLALLTVSPSLYMGTAFCLDQVRGHAIVALWDTEADGVQTREATWAADNLKSALAGEPDYINSPDWPQTNGRIVCATVDDVALMARTKLADVIYEHSIYTVSPRQALATSERGRTPSTHRESIERMGGMSATHDVGNARAHDGGCMNEIRHDWYIAHRWSVYGKTIYLLEPGDVIAIDGRRLQIDGEFYSHVGELASVAEGHAHGGVLLQTCLDTGNIAGEPLVFKVGHWLD